MGDSSPLRALAPVESAPDARPEASPPRVEGALALAALPSAAPPTTEPDAADATAEDLFPYGLRDDLELTARGSHLRRARRRSRPEAPVDADVASAGTLAAPTTTTLGASASASLDASPSFERPFTRAQLTWRLAFTAVVMAGFLALAGRAVVDLILAPGTPSSVSIVLTGFGTVVSAYFLASLYHALRYQPVPSPRFGALPRLTVIVPAYNEGAAVRVALESAIASDYPADRLQILAIDDGSKDDTWAHILAVAEAHPGRITPIRQPKNGGKREALVTGFARATGEFAVTVDSDSKLERGALRAIVAPLLADGQVAAVAGRVSVLNREDNLLTRLLGARFYITFDLARAAQSRFGAVLCTPGALSAYRMDAVRKVVDRWSTQTFFGEPCTIAEDRALTTWLLREGYRSVYQRTALVDTLMPTDARRAARMLVRWERGNLREDIVMLPLLATKWRDRDQWWPTLEIVIELVQYPLAWLGLGSVALRLLDDPGHLATFLALVVFSAVVQCLYCLRSRNPSDFVYGVGYALFAFVGLQWVFPYSLLTVRDGRWMTR